MKKIYANNLTTLSLGRQGENLARQVVFDIRDLESLYGSGTVEVIHQRPGDAQPYPLAVQRDGTLVTWDVTATDTEMSAATANERYGKCELRYYAGETLAKSQIWRTWVESAMDTPSETAPPEPEQGWVEQVLATGVAAQQAADAAKADADRAQGVIQDVNAAGSAAVQSVQSAGDAQVQRVTDEGATQTANAKAQANAAAQSASGAAQSAQQAAESAAVYDTVVADVNQLKQDIAAITPDDTTVGGKPWTSKKIVDSLCQPFEESGNPVQCYPVENYPLGVKVSWEPVQEGEGDPSPDNVRPITGRDAVSVTRCGKNLSELNAFGNVQWASQNESITKLVNTLPAGAYRISFTMTLNQFSNRFTSETVPASGLYAKFYIYNSANKPVKFAMLGTEQSIYRTDTLPKSANVSADINIPEEYAGYRKIIYFYGCGRDTYADGAPNGPLGTAEVSNFQIELGSTATPYEPYTGSTTDIALPETVYGGTLDVETGVLTVDKECKILQGTEQVTKTGDGGTKYFTINGVISIGQKTLTQVKGKCSHFPVKNFTGSDEIQGIGGWDKAIFFRWGSLFETIEDVKTYIAEQYAADTPVQIYYSLNEPYTIQLTPQQIAALSGVNTIYTDANGVIVTGAEDPKHTITQLKNAIISLGGNI